VTEIITCDVTTNNNNTDLDSNIKVGTYSIDHFIEVCFVRGST